MRKNDLLKIPAGLVLAFCFVLVTSPASAGNDTPHDLTEMSLEQLMEVKVTSVSRKEEPLFKAASAIFTIGQEDIRRSGATAIPELLRMVPGMEVARIDGNKWAISARGFNSLVSRKLLVQIDGRSVYTGLYSGVFWDTQDTPLEDIERIEVIRGPGATMWGANAVNGVINIITKNAHNTQGGLVTAGAGNVEKGFGTVRYGGDMGDQGAFRVYGKYFNRDDFSQPNGVTGNDASHSGRGGFRTDFKRGDNDSFTLQGDAYQGGMDQRNIIPTSPTSAMKVADTTTDISGGNILGRWTRTLSPTSDLRLQFYYNREDRKDIRFGQQINTLDLDFQHHFQADKRHDIVWGANSRTQMDDLQSTFLYTFTPASQVNYYLSSFVQDDISIVDGRFHVILGTKFLENSFTGFEIQPSARFVWTPSDRHTVWGAVSRAVRTPARLEDSARINLGTLPGNTLVSVFKNQSLDSEKLIAYELGYRVQPVKTVFLDTTAFFNKYSDLIYAQPQAPFLELSPPPRHITVPYQFTNGYNSEGETYGVEAAATWEVFKFWRLKGGVTWLTMNIFQNQITPGRTPLSESGSSPAYQYNFRSYIDLPYHFELDTNINYVDSLPSGMPAYTRLDLRLGWKPMKAWEFSIAAQNLLDGNHSEFVQQSGAFTVPMEVPRSFYGKITFRY
jgi:iron complex outermembrane receptor protein